MSVFFALCVSVCGVHFTNAQITEFFVIWHIADTGFLTVIIVIPGEWLNTL